MKKIFVFVFCVVLCLCICLVGGCRKTTEKKCGIEKYVSCYYDKVYTATSDNFNLYLIGGKREKTVSVDGTVGALTQFCTLTVTPKHENLCNNQYTYTLTGTEGSIDGALSKDVLGLSFSAEIANFEKIGKLTKVQIVCTGLVNEELQTTDKTEGKLCWSEALEKAVTELADNIAATTDTGNLGREIYVKLVNAPEGDVDAPFYWYVSFIKSPSDYWAVLLDAESGGVISKRK